MSTFSCFESAFFQFWPASTPKIEGEAELTLSRKRDKTAEMLIWAVFSLETGVTLLSSLLAAYIGRFLLEAGYLSAQRLAISGCSAQRKRRCFSDLNGMAYFVPKLNVPISSQK
jgi:hypothetical protein